MVEGINLRGSFESKSSSSLKDAVDTRVCSRLSSDTTFNGVLGGLQPYSSLCEQGEGVNSEAQLCVAERSLLASLNSSGWSVNSTPLLDGSEFLTDLAGYFCENARFKGVIGEAHLAKLFIVEPRLSILTQDARLSAPLRELVVLLALRKHFKQLRNNAAIVGRASQLLARINFNCVNSPFSPRQKSAVFFRASNSEKFRGFLDVRKQHLFNSSSEKARKYARKYAYIGLKAVPSEQNNAKEAQKFAPSLVAGS